MRGDRAQAVTLEAVISALVILASLVFAMQMTAVTPLSASTSSQHIENQLEASADGVLAASVEDGSLRRAVLYFNETSSAFVGATYQGYYAGEPPNITFGQRLDWAFDRRGIAYNVYVSYGADERERTRRLIYRGEPSDNAVSATTTVVLVDDDPLYNGTGQAVPRPINVSATDEFYMSDQSESSLYNLAQVEVVVWRI